MHLWYSLKAMVQRGERYLLLKFQISFWGDSGGGGGGGGVDAGSNHTYLALYTLDMQNISAGSPKTLSQWEYRNKIQLLFI